MVRTIGTRTLPVIAVAALWGPVLTGQTTRHIVTSGKPNAQIVVSSQPPRAVKLASAELQTYIRRITGATLPIRTAPGSDLPVHIYVGRSPHTDRLGISNRDLAHGAFRIVSGDSWLALIGRDRDFTPREPWGRSANDRERVMKEWDALTGETWGNPMLSVHRRYSPALDIWDSDERGSLNAVYQFLRDIGCRWYFPGDVGEVLPKTGTIVLPTIDKAVHPDFPVRHFLFYYNEFWAARKGIPSGIEDVKWQLRLGLWPSQPVLGPGLGHGTMAVHCRDEVKRAHPEYYAMWGGKRATEHLGNYGAACLSSTGLFGQNVKYVRALYDIYDAPMVSVAPADGYGNLCQCELCKGKDTPGRGWSGTLSDYVWQYTDRVAREVRKTHPDRYVTCLAYTTYMLPPESLARLSPNIVVGFCYWRSGLARPEERQRQLDIRRGWLEKLPSKKIFVWDYHRYNMPGKDFESVPVTFPHLIAEDLKSLKGVSLGDYIEIYRNHPTHDICGDVLANDHLNCYVNARLLWDADQDVDALLEEYYDRFYGPARAEMKAFREYAEANWPKATKDVAVIDRLFELIRAARNAADEGTLYAERIDMLAEFMQRMRQLRGRLARGRKDTPKARLPPRTGVELRLDGKLDEAFWASLPAYELSDLETGAPAHDRTVFRVVWIEDSLLFGIQCRDHDPGNLNVTARKDGDLGVWDGDNIEILLETQTHAYYQIALSPAGAVVDVDRENRIDTRWSSGVEAGACIDDEGWSLEVRIPAAGDMAADVVPLSGVAGRKPSKTYPWHFNLCRQRVRENGKELTAFSPTGKPDFHVPLKFAELAAP